VNIEKSLSDKFWEEKQIDFKHIQALSQKKSISEIFSKLLISRGVFEDNYDNYINPNLLNNLPDPFELKDMKKGIERCIEALKNNEKIGIIADYDVDGSTSASILYKFLRKLIFSSLKIIADSAKVISGIGDIRTPVIPASILISAVEIKKNGIALPNAPITK